MLLAGPSYAQTSVPAYEVFFNYPVATAAGEGPAFAKTGDGSAISTRLVALCDDAKATLDVAAYNFDHAPLAAALRRAQTRGVRVRVVTDVDTQHPSLKSPTPNYFWVAVNDRGLMHHKFMVVDAASDEPVVVTGSTNFTDANIYRFYNDLLVLRSKVLAKAYTEEFELLWGSDTHVPNGRNSLSGAGKPRRTPPTFTVGNLSGTLYFSPNDEVSDRIEAEVDAASESIAVQLLVFTYDGIGAAMSRALGRGVQVIGAVENADDPSSDVDFVNRRGGDLRAHPPEEVVHHKYGVFDVAKGSGATVVTGSHNWTYSAETFHDENTLVLTGSAPLAALYYEAAYRRYCDLAGPAECKPRISGATAVLAVDELRAYPNPTVSGLDVAWTGTPAAIDTYRVVDAAGRTVQLGQVPPAQPRVHLELGGLAPGTYFTQIGNQDRWSAPLPILLN